MAQVTPEPSPGTGEWLGVTEAALRAGVSKRTVRRWIAAGTVESRLESADGQEVRLIRGDTLPAITGEVSSDDSRDSLRLEDSTGTSDGIGDRGCDDTGDVVGAGGDAGLRELVTAQGAEISFLRAQLDRRDQAEAELRRLMAALSEQNRHLTGMLEQKALPPAVAHNDVQPRRVRWWNWWRR